MSNDHEKPQQEFAGFDTVVEEKPLEIAKNAKGLAWFAMWVSIVAIVISIVSVAINLSL